MQRQLRVAWKMLRELTTDDAYERYLEHHAATHGDAAPLDRRAFFARQQQQKWEGVNRCC